MESLIGLLGQNTSDSVPTAELQSAGPNPGARLMASETVKSMWKMMVINIEGNAENKEKERSPVEGIQHNLKQQEHQLDHLVSNNRELKGLKDRINHVYDDLVRRSEMELQASLRHVEQLREKYSQELASLGQENKAKQDEIKKFEEENTSLFEGCVKLETEIKRLEDEVKRKDQSYIQSIINQQISRC
ncbi:unnamed protein product [Bursaphelenchus xylophilus]|uniref:(pine wood nematode) hypothetical protein n=1 Tax=Bursaphelenchus xylophilus TaxID=6326 RepID=A0A1I7RSC8_BURXY|nr:unnamed protein product [Bursaphelenchus xylophilus]CAG9123044.1 unnamed protein product [Bursaphelenchus xylophilus]